MANARAEHAVDPARLLLIVSQPELADGLADALATGFTTRPIAVSVDAGRHGVDLLRNAPFDIVVAERDCLGDLAAGSDERIARLAKAASGALLLMLSSDACVSETMSAMRAGAHDCISRDCAPETMSQRITELARRHGKAHLLIATSTGTMPPTAHEPSIPVMRDLVLPMWRQEQRIIENAIQSFAGNIALAAAALELSPSTIYRKRQAWAELDGKRA